MHKRAFLLAALALAASGCVLEDDSVGRQDSDIVDGAPADAYPYSVLIEAKGYPESRWATGTLIAPRVVLTHDVVGDPKYTEWEITAPHISHRRTVAVDIAVHSWGESGDWPKSWHDLSYAAPLVHSVALLKLRDPLNLQKYPELAREPAKNGTFVRRIGSNDDGEFNNTTYVSPIDQVYIGDDYNLPTDYIANRKTLFGDGGGAVMVKNSHKLIAVNWGFGDGETVWAHFKSNLVGSSRKYDYMVRIDMVADWIDETIQGWE